MSSRPLDTAPAVWSQYEAVLDRMDGPARRRAAVAQLVAEDHGVALPRQK